MRLTSHTPVLGVSHKYNAKTPSSQAFTKKGLRDLRGRSRLTAPNEDLSSGLGVHHYFVGLLLLSILHQDGEWCEGAVLHRWGVALGAASAGSSVPEICCRDSLACEDRFGCGESFLLDGCQGKLCHLPYSVLVSEGVEVFRVSILSCFYRCGGCGECTCYQF